MNRVFVLGVDGGAPQLLLKWKDDLPNFRKIMTEGVHGQLISTVPSMTCPAWNCFATGKNPEKIGVYGWEYIGPSHKLTLSDWSTRYLPTIWRLVSRAGKRVGVVGVPLTYPPESVNGFMVSGFPIPPNRKDYAFPRRLIGEIEGLVGEYEPEPKSVSLAYRPGIQQFLNNISEYNHKMLAITEYLMERYEWNLFITCFVSPDRVQHSLWHFMDQNHPYHPKNSDELSSNAIFNFYKELDMILGTILEKTDDSTYFFIVSDHGFGPCHGFFSVNDWLLKKGLLTVEARVKMRIEKKLYSILEGQSQSMKILRRTIAKTDLFMFLLRLLQNIYGLTLTDVHGKLERDFYETINWSKTKAIGVGGERIYINRDLLSDEKYEEFKRELIRSLSEVRNPVNGEPIINEICTKDQLYGENCLGYPPDIICATTNWKFRCYPQGSLWCNPFPVYGAHKRAGLIMIRGSGVVPQEINARITDITPTILYILSVPVPSDVDGEILKQIFSADTELGRKMPTYEDASEKKRVAKKIRRLREKWVVVSDRRRPR